MKKNQWYSYCYKKADKRWAEIFKKSGAEKPLSEIEEDMPEQFAELRKHLIKIRANFDPELVASWMTGEIKKVLNYHDITYQEFLEQNFPEEKDKLVWLNWLQQFFQLYENNHLTDSTAESFWREMIKNPKDPITICFENDLFTEDLDLNKVVEKVLKKNQKAVEDYRNGKTEALNALIGQVKQRTDGKADAGKTRKIIMDKIQE